VSIFPEVYMMNVHRSNILQGNQWQCLLFSEINVFSKGTANLHRHNENKKTLVILTS
jgi:hypothetical protein